MAKLSDKSSIGTSFHHTTIRRTLMIIAMCVTVALNAQNAENEVPRFESDTTGKVNLKIQSIFELTNVETFIMHFLRSKVEYGVIQNGIIYKMLPDRSKIIVNYENAKLTAWIKNDDVIKKEIDYFNGEVVTTKFIE